MKKEKLSRCDIMFILFCCTIPVINWLVMYIYGNASSFVLAFTDAQGSFTWDNFTRFAKEFMSSSSELRVALRNTLLTFVVGLVAYPFQLLVSYFIYKKVPGASVYRVLFFLPKIIFSVALAMVVTRMLSVTGFIAEWVQQIFGMEQVPALLEDSRYANTTVLLHMLWMAFPGDLIIWGGTFARIPEEVLESAKIDGVNWWGEFTKIIVPLVWPTVGLQLVLSFCAIFSASGEVFLLTGGEFGTMTITCWMYKELLKASGNLAGSGSYNYLSAVGLVITIVAIGLSFVIRRWADKAFDEVEY